MNGWKMLFCKWHTFWMVPWLVCRFTVILFHIERKSPLMINTATVLPLKSRLENFSVTMPLMEVSKCWYMEKFPKILIKMKNLKHFTRPKQRSTLRKLFSHLSPGKSLLPLWHAGVYMLYTDICFPSASRMQFLGV